VSELVFGGLDDGEFVGTRGSARKRPFSFPMPTHWCFGSNADGHSWEQRMSGARREVDAEPEPPAQLELGL
jgi:hypothetical protein